MNQVAKSRGKMSIAFSGCGWLTPFHLGVLEGLRQNNLLDNFEYFAGTSGGSLAALIACTTRDFNGNMQITKRLSRDMKFFTNIDSGLRSQIGEQIGSDDVAVACSDKLQVVISRVWPLAQRKCLIVSKFSTVADVVDAVSASCFIPLYSARRLTTRLGSRSDADGFGPTSAPAQAPLLYSPLLHETEQHFVHDSRLNGGDVVVDGFALGGILPPVGRVCVSPFPRRVFAWEGRGRMPDITLELAKDRSEDISVGGKGGSPAGAGGRNYSLGELLYRALIPGGPEIIQYLFDDGQRACEAWLAMPDVEGEGGLPNRVHIQTGGCHTNCNV